MDKSIVWAIPIFFALLGVEILASKISRRKDHLFADMVSNISCGLGEQLTGVFAKTTVFLVYIYLYHAVAPFHLASQSPATWIIGLLGVDFSFYWWNRFCHRTHLGWATHVAHHQSQDYNLSVALRQSWTAKFSLAPFHWPLAIFGVPPTLLLACEMLLKLHQFWLHTPLIGRLGPLGWVLNTPSHHRVHHGLEQTYQNRNFGGILIIWDRLFGTFQAEKSTPTYGSRSAYQSWDPVWANWAHFFQLIRLGRNAQRGLDRLLFWVRPPEWSPNHPSTSPATGVAQDQTWRHRTRAPGIFAYVTTWLTLSVLIGMSLLWFFEQIPQWTAFGMGMGVLFTTWSIARLLGGKRHDLRLELTRLVAFAGVSATWIFDFIPYMGIGSLGLCLVSALWLWHYEDWFPNH